VDEVGNAYIAGKTPSESFPVVNAFQPSHANPGTFNDDAFVSKLSADGSSLLFSSYLGGDHHEYNLDIDVDKKGNIYVSGITQSSNFPTAEAFHSSLNGQTDAFVAKIDGETFSLDFSSYYGGSGWEGGIDQRVGITVNPYGYVYIAGGTNSTDFPTVEPYQATADNGDAFVVKMLIDAKGILAVSPDPVIFPLIEPDQTARETVELSNPGLATVEISKIEVEPATLYGFENKPALPYELDPGKKLEFMVTYSPVSSSSGRLTGANDSGTITLESDAEEPVTKVSLIPGIRINLASDEPDADLSDGVCDTDLSKPDPQVTLRAAIQHVNAMKNEDITNIIFDIPGIEVPIIKPEAALPEIKYPISLDASTQKRGYVVLDGTNAGDDIKGLHITAGNSTVKAMNIMNFGAEGILLEWKGSNLIDDCVIMKNGDGETGYYSGIKIFNIADNRIRNSVISHNFGHGILIQGENATGNLIEHNKIGTRENGIEILSNFQSGIGLAEGAHKNHIRNNLISGNFVNGILIQYKAEDNTISHNLIGVNIHGTSGLANIYYGISIEGEDTRNNRVIFNIISGNGSDGINIERKSKGNLIFNNMIGSDSTGSIAIGNGGHGINISHSDNTHVEYNTIVNNALNGINIDILPQEILNSIGNYIGTIKKDPLQELGNGQNGIFLKEGRIYVSSNYISNHNQSGVRVIDGRVQLEENFISYNKIGLSIDRSSSYDGPVRTYSVHKNKFQMNGSGIIIQGKSVQEYDQANYDQITANRIWNSTGTNTGIHIKNARSTIRGNFLYANLGNAITVEGESEVVVGLNNIMENQEFGLENLNPSISVNAMHNWWDDSSGPGGSGSGVGDKVSDGVDYSDWLTQAVSVFVAAESDTVLVPIGKSDSVTLVFENWAQSNDYLNVNIYDELGWVKNTSPFQVPVPDYPHELSQLYLTIPADVVNNTTNEVQLNATSQANPEDSLSSSFIMLAVDPVPVTMLISPDTVEIEPGDSIQFNVSGYDQFYHSIGSVDWSCTGGTIDDTGLFIGGYDNGIFTVTATEPVSALTAVAQVVISGVVPTGIEVNNGNLIGDGLHINYPNPFDHTTTIKYHLQAPGVVSLIIFDFTGQEIAILVDGKQAAGTHEIIWRPNGLPGGIYISRLEVSGLLSESKQRFAETRRLLLIK